jgi:alanine racemase
MATIGDVARAAGVSRTAVSFAFNEPSRLSAETLARIRRIADELGYYPSPLARSLISKRVGVLGLLIPQGTATLFANPFFAELLRGIGLICDRHDFSVLLVPPAQGSVTRALTRAAVDGFVVVGLDDKHAALDLLRRRRVPFVTLDGQALPDVPAVNVDDYDGAYRAAQHLVTLGHRQALVISISPPQGARTEDAGPGFSGVAARRLEGYRDAFAHAGLASPEQPLVADESTREGGRHAMLVAWARGVRPSAVLAMSDVIALGVMDAARELGLGIPGDISLVGFDDIPAAQLCRPALTTVHQPALEKGMIAARLLVDRQAGNQQVEHQVLAATLVVRESTAPMCEPRTAVPAADGHGGATLH